MFVTMLREEPALLESVDDAVACATAFVATTRHADHVFTLVQAVDDAPPVPRPTEDERTRLERFRERYAEVIGPAAARRIEAGYEVTLFVTRNQQLERLTMRLTSDGGITVVTDVLERDLPLLST